MGIYFGTDGIRGVVNDFLTSGLAYKCGNALGRSKENPVILVGRDTRTTGSFLTVAFASGALDSGANVIDIGICPTAGIAYITKKLGYDYGTVISASHNPPEYNGIKIFDENGFKLGDHKEDNLERTFVNKVCKPYNQIGVFTQDFSLVKLYEDYLVECCDGDLKDLKIVLDCSNGAAYSVAPTVFERLGATIYPIYNNNDGENINNNCGAVYPENMCKYVKEVGADMGFAFDGDSDRIIACDGDGNVIDGDIIIYMLAKYLKGQGKLDRNIVVGTRHTNMGLEKSLNEDGIKLIRTDIGDKYVIAKIEEEKLTLGGEKSGHIIFRELSTTGDGVLTGIKLAEMTKKLCKSLKELSNVTLYPQININCVVNDKMKIINSEELNKEIEKQEKLLDDSSRIMVRVSGTENKIRVMVESLDENQATISAKAIEKVILEVDEK